MVCGSSWFLFYLGRVLRHSSVLRDVATQLDNPITLASGAIVTFNTDNTFDYNPNGAFDYLADSDNATDSFTYS